MSKNRKTRGKVNPKTPHYQQSLHNLTQEDDCLYQQGEILAVYFPDHQDSFTLGRVKKAVVNDSEDISLTLYTRENDSDASNFSFIPMIDVQAPSSFILTFLDGATATPIQPGSVSYISEDVEAYCAIELKNKEYKKLAAMSKKFVLPEEEEDEEGEDDLEGDSDGDEDDLGGIGLKTAVPRVRKKNCQKREIQEG